MSETTEHGGGIEPVAWRVTIPAFSAFYESKETAEVNARANCGTLEALYLSPTPPTRGDQAEVARLRDRITDGDPDGKNFQAMSDQIIGDVRAIVGSPTSSAEPQAAAPVGELRERVNKAAVIANQRFGQWMPQAWIDYFIHALEEASDEA